MIDTERLADEISRIEALLLEDANGNYEEALRLASSSILYLSTQVSVGMMRAPPATNSAFPRKPVLRPIDIDKPEAMKGGR